MTHTTTNPIQLTDLLSQETRVAQIEVRGHPITVTLKVEDDPTVEKEIGRAQMTAQRAIRAANALAALAADSSERPKLEAELAVATKAMDALDTALTFNPRRVVCARLSRKLTEWSLMDGDAPAPLDFDGLYDGAIPTAALEETYRAVVAA